MPRCLPCLTNPLPNGPGYFSLGSRMFTADSLLATVPFIPNSGFSCLYPWKELRMTLLSIIPWVTTHTELVTSLPFGCYLDFFSWQPSKASILVIWIHFIVTVSVLETQSFCAIFNSPPYLTPQIQLGASLILPILGLSCLSHPSLPLYFQFSHFSSGPLATQMDCCKNLPICYPTSD